MISIRDEIQELLDLIKGSTYKEFVQRVLIHEIVTKQEGFPSMTYFEFKHLSATILNGEYLVGIVTVWDDDDNWAWDFEIKERVYFKKD